MKLEDLVVCESVAAITTHLRVITPEVPVNLHGHHPRLPALCGTLVAWDTQIPVRMGRCRDCRHLAGLPVGLDGPPRKRGGT
jgi:hypothetical protein